MPASATAAELLAAFIAAWPSAQANNRLEGVGETLHALCEANHATLRSPAETIAFVRLIAQHAPLDVQTYLTNLHSDDLALACVAGNGNAAAVLEIQRRYASAIDAVCRRFVTASQGADDLRQMLFAKLFVADAGMQPKILQYAGLGYLENWLRVAAVRLFLDLKKRKDRARESAASDDDLVALAHPADLALELVKSEYRSAVEAALREAANHLAPGDRHILRQHLVGKLTIDQISAVLGIHRATAARRIGQACDKLAVDTRARLQAALQIDDAECADVMKVVMSRLEVSLSSLLATRGVA